MFLLFIRKYIYIICPIDNCNYVLCYECIDKIKHNDNFNGKCPACRNININLIASKQPEEVVIDIEDDPRWQQNELNILALGYTPFITNCYFNPLKIYYKTFGYFIISIKFYYGSNYYTSNIYTINLWDKLCCQFICNFILLCLLITASIFLGRTVSWLLFPWGYYWAPVGDFILLAILGLLMILITLVVGVICSLIFVSLGECLCYTCCYDYAHS